MPEDILDKLVDLHRQATEEKSHFYVAECCREAINEITRLRECVGAQVTELPTSFTGVVSFSRGHGGDPAGTHGSNL